MHVVAQFPTNQEAHLLVAFLGTQGIEATVFDEITALSLSEALGGARVAVKDVDLETARAATAEYLAAQARTTVTPDDAAPAGEGAA